MIETRLAELPLGLPVAFSHVLRRTSGEWEPTPRAGWSKAWKPFPVPAGDPRVGILVGVRTLANGRISGGGYDDPIVFKAERTFPALLVSFALYRRPVFVLPEHATRLVEVDPDDEVPSSDTPLPFEEATS